MDARLFVATVALITLWCDLAVARDLTIVARSSVHEAINEVFTQPFIHATTIATQGERWDGGLDVLRTQAKGPDSVWDLVMVDSDELATGCAEGLFEKLD